jgi:glycerophosphoryl diester phosphodiesterase
MIAIPRLATALMVVLSTLAVAAPALGQGKARKRAPIVIAHRGASGYLPEHTLEAYRLAVEQGADFIEPDLVATADGELIARHENELSGTTDVAIHAAFASRRTRKRIDGREIDGWFSEDFTLAEIRMLRARERLPGLRVASAAHDGRYGVPSLRDIVQLVREAECRGRYVGIYPETKRPTWFAHEGRRLDGSPIGISLGDVLVRTLVEEGFTDPRRVYVQSFEIANLVELAVETMPRHGVGFPLVQLLGDTGTPSVALTSHLEGPWDLAFHGARGDDLSRIYGTLPAALREPRVGYAALARPEVLAWLRASHASGIGPWKQSLLPRKPLGTAARAARSDGAVARLARRPTTLAADALAGGLAVHAYTLRAEPVFLAVCPDGTLEPVEHEMRRLLALGVSGVFIDQPDRGVAVRDALPVGAGYARVHGNPE